MKKVVIIGAGFGGLSAACYLGRMGYSVEVYEKNSMHGGRAWVSKSDGFTFDMGPSWYMMPDVFDEFFADFGKKTSDFYTLKKLDPSYKIFSADEEYSISTAPHIYELFEKLEPGSSESLKKLLDQTSYEYNKVRRSLLDKPMLTVADVMQSDAVHFIKNPSLVRSYHSRIASFIKNPELQKILEFMVVFMGGSPKNIPALYTLLTHVDLNLGIWYPMGGMGKLADAMRSLAESYGAKFIFNAPVQKIIHSKNLAGQVVVNNIKIEADIIVVNADYHHAETQLLGRKREKTWQQKTLSPSGLMAYIGVNKKLKKLEHHNLFLDSDWDQHFDEVFKWHEWSREPMFYASVPSKTDNTIAPKGMENLFILAPLSNGITPSREEEQALVDSLIARIEKRIGQKFRSDIVSMRIESQTYFEKMFNAYKGNAFGLAHTLKQSAFLRPPMRDKSLRNVFYVGQYTNPGTGVPIVTLSGKVVANLINSQ